MSEGGVVRYVTTIHPAKFGAISPVQKRALVLKVVQKIYYTMKGFDLLVMEPVRMFTGGSNVPLSSIEAIISLSTTLEDWAFKVGVRVVKVYPNSWRKVVLGSGKATKKDSIRYVEEKHGRVLGEDAAEAVCQAEYGVGGAWKKKLEAEQDEA